MVWYVLYTAARAEKQVAQRVQGEGVETFLPLHKRKKRWSDRVKVVEEPLFRSYVFVKCEEHVLYNLRQVPGVASFIWYDKRPARVRDVEIDAIKEFLNYAENREILTSGDQVQIMCGSFEKREGEVLWTDGKVASLFLEELGAKICVDLVKIEKKQK
ncbi:MAG: UpxY family transcription antiterminator [Bacteroidales bacterium]|jgi:transcription antitermination factor NusG|nr:UpxY family transcription antiterminator [Bacteroidales bacterium]